MLVLLSLPQHSGFMPKTIQNALLALAFLACGGLHIVLRLLSLHLCNEYPSLPKKKKKKRREELGRFMTDDEASDAVKVVTETTFNYCQAINGFAIPLLKISPKK